MMYRYNLTDDATDQIMRAMELADALHDCVDVYMQEIAEEDSLPTRMLARRLLAQRLGDDE